MIDMNRCRMFLIFNIVECELEKVISNKYIGYWKTSLRLLTWSEVVPENSVWSLVLAGADTRETPAGLGLSPGEGPSVVYIRGQAHPFFTLQIGQSPAARGTGCVSCLLGPLRSLLRAFVGLSSFFCCPRRNHRICGMEREYGDTRDVSMQRPFCIACCTACWTLNSDIGLCKMHFETRCGLCWRRSNF
jgi:hypothetical protein